MSLTIATWNINSVRLRIGLVERFLEDERPDILCLQETKCADDQFPQSDIRRFGYEHIAIHGQKAYHGVAIFSRLPIAATQVHRFCQNEDARHIGVTLAAEAGRAAGLTIHNFYVPAGGDIPDPLANPKFAHKLSFLEEMREWGRSERGTLRRSVLVGDLNVAPLETDVWSHRQMLDVVSHTPGECQRLNDAAAEGGWVDAVRALRPEPEKLFTWWSYRAQDWDKSDRGRRLDHIWVTRDMRDAVAGMAIHRHARGWDRPSDHVPVMVSLDL